MTGRPPFDLSPRELELVQHFTHGLQPKDAAALMGVKPSSVREYRRSAARKMGVTAAATALQIATTWLQARNRAAYLAGYRRGSADTRERLETAWRTPRT
jgi:DNA-binding NarL/FixJ family response regulator